MDRLIMVRPVKTEKSFKLANVGTYTFAVNADASKDQIIAAIKQYFNVDVSSLTTLMNKGKLKTNWKNRKKYTTPAYKKVYVKLAKGQKLELYK